MEYELIIGLETHVQLKPNRNVVWLCQSLRGRAQHPGLPCLPCMPGHLPHEEALRLTPLTGYLLIASCQAMWNLIAKLLSGCGQELLLPSWLILPLPRLRDFEIASPCVCESHAHLRKMSVRAFTLIVKAVDFNRGGVPLLEIVCRTRYHQCRNGPCLSQCAQGYSCHGDQRLHRHEKGMVRCDVNISVPKEALPWGQS